MTKKEAIELIDNHKNQLINPVEMLHWTWLRVIINHIEDHNWEAASNAAEGVLSR